MYIERKIIHTTISNTGTRPSYGSIDIGPSFGGQLMSFNICENKIIISHYAEGEPCDFIRKCNRAGQIGLPANALKISGLFPGEPVDVLNIGNNKVIISKIGEMGKKVVPLTQYILELDHQKAYEPAKEYKNAPLNGSKKLRIPRDVFAQLGFDKNDKVIVSVNRNTGIWLEITPAKDRDISGLETRESVNRRFGKHLMNFDGLTYVETLNGSLVSIPSPFLLLFGQKWRDKSDVNFWVNTDKECLVIEGPEIECELCGDDIRSLPAAAAEVQLCDDCLPNGPNTAPPVEPVPSHRGRPSSNKNKPNDKLGGITGQMVSMLERINETLKNLPAIS